MILRPKKLGNTSVPEDILVKDKKGCKKFGPCGVGEKAIYLNSFYIDRRYYVPFASITRIYKRIAMSKGGFSGKGMFASIPYLVVEYDSGQLKQCNFKHEENVDRLIDYVKVKYPNIKIHSKQAEKKLIDKANRIKEKKAIVISDEVAKSISELEKCSSYLKQDSELFNQLSISAKRKRVYDNSNPAYKWVALFITLMGMTALIYGIYALMTQAGFGMYFLLFGLAAIFLFSSANILPTKRNNGRWIEKQLDKTIADMKKYISDYPQFPLPAYYAHPIVLNRLIEILAEGRAKTIPAALDILKADLKSLNSSVAVEQDEYEEIIAIKPLFLIMDYR
ncbi:MAG: ATPase P [Lachnospiraceae bacterium]